MSVSFPFLAFTGAVLLLLLADLLLAGREKVVSLKKAAAWSAFWVALSLGFNAWIWHAQGSQRGLEFLAGYLIEYALSVDNLFVFILIFSAFQVPAAQQHKVLFWGILGALVVRGVMIALGLELVAHFSWMLEVFGLFLLVTGVRMLFPSKKDVDLEKSALVRGCRRWGLPPLAVALVVIEVTDLIIAVDSIPAVLAVTRDPFIAYTSNICAILGLRSLYFVLAGVMSRFVYLKYGLAAVLTFIGAKMLAAHHVEVPIGVSLGVIGACLAVAVGASLAVTGKKA